MDRVPKPEPGSPPPVFATSNPRNLRDMSVSELVAVLRAAFKTEDYDKVEEVLESRFTKLKVEVEFQRLGRVVAEEELRKREDECERGKKVKDNYEKLLKSVKEAGGLAGRDSLEEVKRKNDELESELNEMKKKNAELEGENCEMKKKNGELESELQVMKKKNAELESENCEMKKKWMGDKSALAEIRVTSSGLEDEKAKVYKEVAALTRRNSELEEAVKGLATVEELRAENRKLAEELSGRVARLEDDTRILMNADTGGGNIEGEDSAAADLRAGFGVNDEEDIGDYDFGNDTGGTTKRNDDTHHSLGGVAAKPSVQGDRIVKLDNGAEIINLDDSDDDDDDGCTSKRWMHGKKALSGIKIKNEPQSLSGKVHQKNTPAFELLKRKMSFLDSSSSSSSSDDELDVDKLLTISSVFNKKRKT